MKNARVFNKIMSVVLAMVMVLSMLPMSVFATQAEDDVGETTATTASVAKVGNTEYGSIDEAIENWTNGTTLTLLDNVTLSDVVPLKSTEHHILDLGTYTMTAASGKNAFVIQACGNGSAERSVITINADATNPGGINAGNKCIVYYKYADGGISTEDRPIIKINGGVFTGSTSSYGTAGIYTIGTAARKCATVNIAGGTFNCSINGSGKSKLIISGGTFNYSVGSQGDSTASRLISGGTFKSFGFMTADSNNTKFWIGTSMGNSNVGAYIDDNGYLVVGGPVVTEAGETFEASSANYGGFSSYLQYSSAKDNGLYYTSVEEAFADNNKTTGSVTVYVDELDMTDVSYKGTIVVPEGETVTITVAEGTTPTWTVVADEAAVTYVDENNTVLEKNEDGSFTVPGVNPTSTLTNCYTSDSGYWGECGGNASESFVFKFYHDSTYMGSTSLNNVDGIIDGDVYVTWSIKLDAESNTDEYWDMAWDIRPTLDMQPTRVEHWVDGVKAAEVLVEPNWSDRLSPVVAAVTDENGTILSYVNGTEGHTLANAFANGGNITLLRDVELTNTVNIPAEKTVTLDLNGKTIDGTGNVRIALMSYGNLTVKDSSAEQTGVIKAGIATAGNAVNICAGTFTLESGSIYSLNNAILIDGKAAVINIKGGTITAEPTTRNSAVMYVSSSSETEINITDGEMVGYNGILLWNNTTVNMNGGSIEGKGSSGIQGNGTYDNTEINISGDASVYGYYTAIYHPQNGELNISENATLTGWTGVVVKSGKVTVSGGTISGTGEAGEYEPVSSGFTDTGDGLYVEHYDNSTNSENYGTPVVSVTGGVFNSTNGAPIASYANPQNASNGVAALEKFVSGGTFNKAPAAELAAEGYEFAADGNGAYGVAAKTDYVAQIGETKYETLAGALAEAKAGDEIVLLADVTENVTVPAGVIFNGNGKQVGNITAAGEITFKGHTKANNFSVQYTNTTINIGKGACLEITGSDRLVVGHGCTFNITGTIENAKTANTADLTPSLIMPGASFTGAGVNFNVTNAYVKAPSSYCSSSSSASGTFDFNIENSIIETAGKLAFESQSTAATVNFDLKNSVLTTGSHLVFGVSRGEVVIDNSNVNVGTSRQIENQSTMTVKNGSVVNGAVATSSNAKNPGTLIIDNATYAVTGEFSGSDLGTGTLIVKKGAAFTAGSITKANIVVDAAGMAAGDEINITADLANHAGTLEVINNDTLKAEVHENGNIVLVEVTYAAEVNGEKFATLQAAIDAAKDGETVTICAGEYDPINISNKNITIEGAVGEDGALLTTIKGGDPAITGHSFNGTIKNLKLVDAWKVMYAEPAGNVTVDNVYVTGAMYGFHLVAYSEGLTWNIWNSYMDLRWANSFGVYGNGDAQINVTGNTFEATDPYYGEDYGALHVNSFLPKVTIKENYFGKSARIFVDKSVTDTSNIIVAENYHADGYENAFAVDEDAAAIEMVSYYKTYNAETGEMSDLVTVPKGTLKVGYLNASYVNGIGAFYGEATGVVANESFVVKLYSGEALVATATLNDKADGQTELLNGVSRSITWHAALSADGDNWWKTEWVGGSLNVNNIPDKVELWIDGVKTSEGNVEWNSGDLHLPIFAAFVNENGDVQKFVAGTGFLNGVGDNAASYHDALKDALGESGTVALLRDVEIAAMGVVGEVTLDLNGHTVTFDNTKNVGFQIKKDASLTVTDSSEAGTGAIVATHANARLIDLAANGNTSFTLLSGSLKGTKTGIYAANATADVKVSGGSVAVDTTITDASAMQIVSGNASVTGGTFSTDVSQYCAEGYECEQNADGTYGVAAKTNYVAQIGESKYTSLQGAVNAAQAGQTVTVIADISGEAVNVDKALVITGEAVLTDVSINAVSGCTELTVSGLTFTGNSWINSGSADKLTVSNVTANVTPSNTAQTNSRSAFISLGRSEQHELELVVENSKIVSLGGSDPILGWAAVTMVELTGNTFGDAENYQENSDSVKFMAIAKDAEFTITNNTLYSNYNGIVFGQNTTRDNAYTATLSGNKFYGTADHVWIEVSGSDTCHAKVNVTSDNVVAWDGETEETFEAWNIAAPGSIANWTAYAGVDVETNAEGKVIGGTLTYYAEDAIAEGYEVNEIGVVVKADYVAQIGETKYATLADALAEAKDGETVILLTDVELDASVQIDKTVTFDLNGCKLTGPDVPATQSYYAFIVNGGGALTLKDTSAAQTGEIWAKCYGVEIKGGSFTMDSGKITATNNKSLGSAVVNYGGTVTIEGGSLAGALDAVYTAGYFADAETVIKGGEFIGTVYIENYDNEYTQTVKSASADYATVEGYEWVMGADGLYALTEVTYVAQIGETKYATLADALAEAKDGETVELLWTEGDAPISMAGSVCGGKTVTITGTADVDWTLGNLFIGRGDAGNGKVIFDGANITSSEKKTAAATGIHVSGGKATDSSVNYGTLEIRNSIIELDYLINRNETIVDDNSTLTVYGGCYTHGRDESESTSGTDEIATLTIGAGSTVNVINENGMGVGGEGKGEMTVHGTYTANMLNVSAKGVVNVDNGTLKISGTVTPNKNLFISGSSTVQIENLNGRATVLDDAVLTDSYIRSAANGTTRVLGDLTLNGGFEAAYFMTAGSAAETTGYEGTITIADGTTLKASYGVETNGNVTLNGGTIELSGGNAEGQLWGVVFQDGNVVLNSDITVTGNTGTYAPIYFTDAIATINSTITQRNSGGEPMYIGKASVVTLGTTAEIDTLSVHGSGKLILDAAGMDAGEYANVKCGASGFTGALEVINNDTLKAEIVDGKIVLVAAPVAEINGEKFATLAEAFAAATKGDVIELLDNITVTEQIKITDKGVLSDITLKGNGHTITANLDQGSQSVLYFGDTSTSSWATGVKISDLTIEGTARFALALMGGTSSELTNVTVTGDYYYGINMFGTHGATMTDCDIVTVFTNGQDDNPLSLVNTHIGHLYANKSDVVDGAKVFADEDSVIDELTFWGDSTIMIDPEAIDNITKFNDTLVAEVNGVRYKNLQAAINAAQAGDTVKLLAPVVVAAGETLTLDKAVTITYTSNVPGEDMITNRGTLVIDGAALVYTNTDTTGSNVTVSTISCEPGSVLTVNSGVVQNNSADNSNGGTGSFAYAIDLVTNGNLGDVTATINGGGIISTNYMAIRQFVNGEVCKNTLTVNDGSIKGATRGINIQLKNNMAYTTINGGTIEGGDYSLCFLTTSENLSVTGGEFKGGVWYSGTDGFITGGTFDSEPDAAYAADGYKFVDNADGTWGVVAEEVEATIAAKSATLLYEDEIQVRYRFAVPGENIAEYGMLIFASAEDAESLDASKATQNKELEVYQEKDGLFYGYGYTDGIAAKNMGDSQFVVGYVKQADGSYVYAKAVEYSPKKYATNMVSKTDTDEATKLLCNALMQYGAAAQLEFTYKTDDLMNVGFAAVEYDSSVLGESVFSVDTTETNGFTTKSATLLFEGAITYRIRYTANKDLDGKTLYAEYTVGNVTESVEMQLIEGSWYAYIAGIAAKDMDETLKVKPYYLDGSDNKVYGAELVYSGYEYARRTIDSTSESITESDKNLAEAFAMYVNAADKAIVKK